MGSLLLDSRLSTVSLTDQKTSSAMDAIRKKMKSLKDETDQLYAIIKKFEDETKEANTVLEQAECDIRDYGKKVHGFEIEFDETLDKLNKANESYRESRAGGGEAEEYRGGAADGRREHEAAGA